MNREVAIDILRQRETCRECVADCTCKECDEAFDMAITALSQEQQSEWERDHEILKAYADGQESMEGDKRNIEEIVEVMKCDADADTKCRMISNILNAKPHYFKSQEPCKDAISRQAAIDAIEKTKSAMTTDGEIYVAKINAEMNIQQLPSVSTEKIGHWVKSKDGYMRCDYCGSRGSAIKARFCHHCGARMEVEE